MLARILPVIFLAALIGCANCEKKDGGPKAANYTETIPGSKVTFEMVAIPGEKPFWIGKTEVTWSEYQIFCDEYDNPPPGVDSVSRPSPPGHGSPAKGLGLGRQPAMGVTWNGAKRYCEWLSQKTGRAYRLPTEAEWAFACGAAPAGPLGDHAWFEGNSEGMSHEVGLKKPNAFGLHDMLGNVMEYTGDLFTTGGKDPVLRGGSFSDPAAALEVGRRQEFLFKWVERDPQRPRSQWWAFDGPVGFRLARSGE